jgi:leucyl-tRNA---protein transferase
MLKCSLEPVVREGADFENSKKTDNPNFRIWIAYSRCMDNQESNNHGRDQHVQWPDFDRTRVHAGMDLADTIGNVHECSYLPGLVANLPLALPSRLVTLEEFDFALANGLRRSGVFLYHTACGPCSACEPLRVIVPEFRWTDSWRRIQNRGDRTLHVQASLPSLDQERLNLFNRHRMERGLGSNDRNYADSDYESFLVDSCCGETIELSFWHDSRLVAISIIDCGKCSLSSVYTYFDPDYSKWSLGTYSILKQIEFAKLSERKYVYLGMYVQQNRHLNYKARFFPHEKLRQGAWVRSD